jgi:hypothetical protein
MCAEAAGSGKFVAGRGAPKAGYDAKHVIVQTR